MSLYDHFSEQELQILQARAARVADSSESQRSAQDQTLAALRMTVCGERYAVSLDAIAAVYDRTPIVPVPSTPPFVAGIANIRGHIIPVLDLATLLSVSQGEKPVEAALIVAESEDLTVAFCVEEIGDVASLPTGIISALPASVELAESAYLHGALPDGTVLLNISAILNDPRLLIDQAVA